MQTVNKQQSLYSPKRRYNIADQDPYSPVIVEDLLQGVNEWRNIQDIVRLTFKALTDVVKAQGETLHEIERQLPTKANKTEVNNSLSLKANISEVSRAIADVSANIENKLRYEDLQENLKDYTLKSDFSYMLSTKASVQDLRNIMDSKVHIHELKTEISDTNIKLDDLQKDIHKKLYNCVNSRDFNQLISQVDLKANSTDVFSALDEKANKQSVANALHKKVNKADIDSIFERKVDLEDLQTLIKSLEQKVDLSTLEKIGQLLDQKVDRKEIEQKLNNFEQVQNLKMDFNEKFSDLSRKYDEIKKESEKIKTNINNKGDINDINRLIQLINSKVDIDYFSEQIVQIKQETFENIEMIKTDLNYQKALLDDQQSDKHSKLEKNHEKFSKEIQNIQQIIKNIQDNRQNDIDDTLAYIKNITNSIKKELQNENQKIINEIDSIKKFYQEHISDFKTTKIDQREYLEFKQLILDELDNKCNINEIQKAMNVQQIDITNRFVEFKDDIKEILRIQDNELYNLLHKKANLVDMQNELSNKANISVIQNMLGAKLNQIDFDEIKKILDRIKTENIEKVSVKEFDIYVSKQKHLQDEIQKSVILKANIKDVCTLLDTKANIDTVNKTIEEIHLELDQKANQEDLTNIANDQAIINESLCAENILGRWTWKSGEIKSGFMVPWEIQVVNTLSDNFLWEKDKTCILVISPGLYEITLGFYSKKSPTIQIIVNGDPIMSAMNTQSNRIYNNSTIKQKEFTTTKHPSGSITGLTLIDFIVLPARARVSITYNAEYIGEGFLGLRRL